MSNTKPRVRVCCYTRGCKDTSPNYGPACDHVSEYVCWNPVQLKDGAAADGRCRKCRVNGVMGTVVDTGDEKDV